VPAFLLLFNYDGGLGDLNSRRESRFWLRVPGVYLTWANSVFLAFFAFNGINNLRIFNVAFSSIPTAPTNNFLILL